MTCLEGHKSNPADGSTLDSNTSSKQSEKEKALEIICWIMARNSSESLEDESIGTIIKLYSSQGNSNDLLGTAGVLGSTISSTSSLVLLEDTWTSLIIGVPESTGVSSIMLAIY